VLKMSNDYLRLIYLQIDRCNSIDDPNKLYEASIKLYLLCQCFVDDKFKEEFSKIQEGIKDDTWGDELDSDPTPYHKAGLDILSACISLLDRKGIIPKEG